MVVPIDLRSSHVFAQWLRLIAGAYMLAINRHARLLHFLVSVNDHNCGVAVFRRFSTRYFGIFQFFLPPPPPPLMPSSITIILTHLHYQR